MRALVAAFAPSGSGWTVKTDTGRSGEPFDWVVVTAPAAQTAALLPNDSPLKRLSAGFRMKSCFALMLGFEATLDTRFDAALVRERDISWVSINSSKPGRNGATTVVVHASNAWADRNIDADIADVREHLLDELGAATGIDGRAARHIDVQRWRYANIDRQHDEVDPIDAERRLAVCGDWLIRGRVESAFTSAEHLLARMPELVS